MTAHFEPIDEPARRTPVAHEADLCVIGGSCTGVFAAVRAARLGLKVTIVEANSIFGGMATAAHVNVWHSTLDAWHREPIIGGLTYEVIDRLRARGAVCELTRTRGNQFQFNSAELAATLDELISQHAIRPFFSARLVAAQRQGGRVTAAIIEDKSGRRAIRARIVIDASGDGDLVRHAGFEAYQRDGLQPASLQALIRGFDEMDDDYLARGIAARAEEFGFPRENSSPWFVPWPGAPGINNVFGVRMNGLDASDADSLSSALIEGRRLHRALLDMARAEGAEQLNVVAWAPALGVRETWHARCLHQLTAGELLQGHHFEDSIANGTYPVDIHSTDGTFLRYLDGIETVVKPDGSHSSARWRPESDTPRCYHIPYRSLVPRGAANVLVAGRVLDADREAFGGVRVMVNMNQTGEAAGVAAALALRCGVEVAQVAAPELRAELARGGSIML